MTKKTKRNGNITNSVQQVYESKAGVEALIRGGQNPKLKGVVHEVLFKDKLNAANLLNGKRASLTQSTTAVRDDVIVKSVGKVVERYQLKDAPASVERVIKQASGGKYAGTKLVGTAETVEKYAAAGGDGVKSMSSSGISSKTTERIADKALGKMGSAKNVMSGAGRAGVIGVAVGCGITAITSVGELIDGEIDGAEFAGRVAKAGVTGGVCSAGGAVAATAASAATGAAITASGIGAAAVSAGGVAATAVAFAPVVVAAAAGVLVGSLISSLFEGLFD